MKSHGFLSFVLAVSVFTLPLAAQENSTPQVAENFAPVVPAVAATPSALPETPTRHKFFDHQQLLGLYVHSGMRMVDTIKTCRELSHGGVEDWIPTQTCGGIVAWQAGSVGLTLGVGWLLHKHGHHRLERLAPWVGTGFSAAGWTKSVLNIH